MEAIRFWLAENGNLLVFLVGLSVTVVAGLQLLTRPYAVPGTEEMAEVVRFGSHGDHDGDHLIVVVRTPDGSIRTLGANPGDVFYCHPGSRIRLVRHGSHLTVQGPGCRP